MLVDPPSIHPSQVERGTESPSHLSEEVTRSLYVVAEGVGTSKAHDITHQNSPEVSSTESEVLEKLI